MIEQFFEEKYGKEICANLFNDNQLLAENIKAKNEHDQLLVKTHVDKINQDLNLHLDVYNNNWAFDFSGWLGKLETREQHLKKYMIIGLEPHVERYDYQITYGLSEKAPNGQKRFTVNLENKFEIGCENDSSLIWTNLFKILANNDQIEEVLNKGNEKEMKIFLNQFYIADLCHFAPQDKAKAVHDIKDWKKIRYEVALHFLKKEIDLIKPEIIITQGNGVFKELKRILRFNESNSYPIGFGKNTWLVKRGQEVNSNYEIISIPHFGTELNYKTFYMKNRESVKKILIENGLI